MRKSLILYTVFLFIAAFSCTGPERINYEGTYLDQDNNEPNLFITQKEDGSYDVAIGVFRLTWIEDGTGRAGAKGLHFTATDAAGKPIGGLITLDGNVATVTFTDSTWPLLENGSNFQYTRAEEGDLILKTVKAIYEDVAENPFDSDALAIKYCSAEWNRMLEHNKKNPDASYWVQGQDCGDLKVSDIELESYGKNTASVRLVLHNLGKETPLRLFLVYEGRRWLIDNFVSLEGNGYDWKKELTR